MANVSDIYLDIYCTLATKLSFQSGKESVGTTTFRFPDRSFFKKWHWKGTVGGGGGVYNDKRDNLDDEVWEGGEECMQFTNNTQTKTKLKSSVAAGSK